MLIRPKDSSVSTAVTWSEDWLGLVAFDEVEIDDSSGVIGGWAFPERVAFLAVLFIKEITNSSRCRTWLCTSLGALLDFETWEDLSRCPWTYVQVEAEFRFTQLDPFS
jgi:hypothetical protein